MFSICIMKNFPLFSLKDSKRLNTREKSKTSIFQTSFHKYWKFRNREKDCFIFKDLGFQVDSINCATFLLLLLLL